MPKKITKTAAKKQADKSKLNAYILLDRSGSMANRMAEALSSINTYVATLAENKNIAATVTLAAFDQYGSHHCDFSIVRKRQSANDWHKVTADDVHARGGTPLYDAISRITMAAEIEGEERTSIVIITDGAENASKDTTKDQARAMLDKCRAKGWDVVYMGADFNAFSQADFIGVQMNQTINVPTGFFGSAMRGMAVGSANYAATGMTSSFTEESRKKAGGGVKAGA